MQGSITRLILRLIESPSLNWQHESKKYRVNQSIRCQALILPLGSQSGLLHENKMHACTRSDPCYSKTQHKILSDCPLQVIYHFVLDTARILLIRVVDLNERSISTDMDIMTF